MKTTSLLFLLLFFLICCKNTPEKKANKQEVSPLTKGKQVISANTETNGKALDMLLTSCGDYSYFENYFRIPYNGCLYNPTYNPNNILGLADIVLIPKQQYELTFFANSGDSDEQNSINSVISKMSANELKDQFKIIVFLIDKQYLSYIENAEINYYPDLPYKVKIYEYETELKEWNLESSIEIHNEGGEYKWVKAQIEKKATHSSP